MLYPQDSTCRTEQAALPQAEDFNTGHFDARNEATCKAAAHAIKGIDAGSKHPARFPFI